MRLHNSLDFNSLRPILLAFALKRHAVAFPQLSLFSHRLEIISRLPGNSGGLLDIARGRLQPHQTDPRDTRLVPFPPASG